MLRGRWSDRPTWSRHTVGGGSGTLLCRYDTTIGDGVISEVSHDQHRNSGRTLQRHIARRPHHSSTRDRAGHLGDAGREHGRDPGLAEARSRCRLRRRHLLLEGHGAPARVPDRQQPDALRLHLLRPPAGADGVGGAGRERQDRVLRQRHRLVGGAARRHRRHGRRCRQGWQVPVPAARLRHKASRRLFRRAVGNRVHPHRPAPDHHRQGHARRRRRLQPAVEGLSAGRRREADALHRRLPEGLEDAADLRRELFPAPRRCDRRRAAAAEGRRHAGDAGEHRHREGQAVPARRDTRQAPDRRRARSRSDDE